MTESRKNAITKKILEEKLGKETAMVMLLTGQNEDGINSYVYIAVRTDCFKEFQDAYQKGPVNLEEYGVILAEGTGLPSDEVRKRMTDEFNFNHEQAVPVA